MIVEPIKYAYLPWLEERNDHIILIRKLEMEPIVKKVELYYRYIKIYFTNGLIEEWWIKELLSKQITLSRTPHFGSTVNVEQQIFADEQDRYIIRHKAFKGASFYRRRLVVHELIQKIIDMYIIPIDESAIVEDYKALLSMNPMTHVDDDTLYIYKSLTGKLLLLSLDGQEEIYKALKCSWHLHNTIMKLLRNNRDITISSIIKFWKTSGWINKINYKVISPNVYRAIIRKFGLQGKVIYDPNPSCSKAIAAWLEKCQYHSNLESPNTEKFLGEKFKRPLDFHEISLFDNNFEQPISIPDMNADFSVQFDTNNKPSNHLIVKSITISPKLGYLGLYA